MKKETIIMGMPVVVHIVDASAKENDIQKVFSYFQSIDQTFSTYKNTSEIAKINSGELQAHQWSTEMKHIFALSEETKTETDGYFDIRIQGKLDPSGLVKGYAIFQAAEMLRKKGYNNFYVEIAGDIHVYGRNERGLKWKVGIQNPFDTNQIVKVVYVTNQGIATSGTYKRKNHIYNPKQQQPANDIASITVIGPNVYESDRFATAAFAMGERGISFIESLKGCEGYMITKEKRAYYTTGFEQYVE